MEEEFDFDTYDQGIINLLDTTFRLSIEGKIELDWVYQTCFWIRFEECMSKNIFK